jgi:hypothetical protein
LRADHDAASTARPRRLDDARGAAAKDQVHMRRRIAEGDGELVRIINFRPKMTGARSATGRNAKSLPLSVSERMEAGGSEAADVAFERRSIAKSH